MKVRANGIDIEVEDSGPGPAGAGQRPVVLLIMGLGMQLVAWPPAVVQLLVDAGYRVIRFDNRDIGLSQHFDHLGTPNLLWAGLKHRLGWAVKAPYTLHDMALDSIGVLDALGVGKAHVVGVSMGGMIAQRVALAAPERVQSLTSIMSSSGARDLPQADPRVMKVLFSRPADSSRDAIVAHYVRLYKAIGSPGFPTDEAELRQRIAMGVDRSFHPSGTMRQMVAIAADATRAQELARIAKPTLVLHGEADPLVPFAHGQDTARRIPGARFAGIAGMGHDLAAGVVERLLPHMAPFLLAHR
ncbi:MAG: alpha/beta fold hydrolase [Rhodoferax sp.]|nr:alpha/beta fold hydrolase [Rhodoferax sp.]